MQNNFKAIFWDNDGVLVDTEPIYFKSAQEVFRKYGVEYTRKYYIDHHLKLNESVYEPLREKGFSEEKIEKIRKERNAYLCELFRESENVPVIDGVSETLEKLCGEFVMGVVTSSRKNHFDIKMEVTGLRKYFDFFLTNDDVEFVKPDPELYLKAIEKSGFQPSKCLVIEDTERGVVAAKAAGLTCYAIPTEISQSNDFSGADMVLSDVWELLKIL